MAYSARSDVEDVFGVDNVAKWADLDADADATKIANRITRAIAAGDAKIDQRFRSSQYAVPLVPGTSGDVVVTDWSARLAGVWLYESRGTNEMDQKGRPFNRMSGQEKKVMDHMDRVMTGKERLDAEIISNQSESPFVR